MRVCPKQLMKWGLAGLTVFAALLVASQPVSAQRERPVLVGRAVLAPAEFPPEAAQVQVVLIGDTRSEIGAACAKDIAAFRAALSAGFGAPASRLVFHDLTGLHPGTQQYWTPQQVAQYLTTLRFGDNDTLVVFQSGHGSVGNRLFPERTHMLGLNAGSIPLGAIHDALRNRHLRALIVLTDCCSNIRERIMVMGNAAQPIEEINPESIRNLFLGVVGEISITAAEDGVSARAAYVGSNPGNAGSAFTVAMLRLLYDRGHTYRTWTEFFPRLRDETFAASGNAHRAHAFQLREESEPRVSVNSPKPTLAAKPMIRSRYETRR